jgi:hypothetical protein
MLKCPVQVSVPYASLHVTIQLVTVEYMTGFTACFSFAVVVILPVIPTQVFYLL